MNEKRSKNKPLHSVLNNVGYLLSEILREHRFLFVLIVTEALCGILAPILGIYLPKIALELVIQRAGMREILGRLGGFIALLGGVIALRQYANSAKYIRYNDLRNVYMRRLFYKSLECDYAQIESAEGQTKYERAVRTLICGDWSGTSKTIVGMLALFTSAASFLIFSGMLASLQPLILVLLIGLSAVNYFALSAARRAVTRSRTGESARSLKKSSTILKMYRRRSRRGRMCGCTAWRVGSPACARA